jgi:hypothetical protein
MPVDGRRVVGGRKISRRKSRLARVQLIEFRSG